MHPLRTLPSLLVLTLASIGSIASPAAAAPESAPSPVVQVDDPAVMGQWSEVFPWPDKAVHSILMHTGKVLWYRGESTDMTFTWDPVTDQIQSQPFLDNIFCSGHSVMPDGRVLVTSGRIGTSGSLGPKYSFFFDPITETWARGPDMRLGRYYPTQLALGDGRTLVFSGYDDTHTVNEMVESFMPGTGIGGTDQWELLEGANRFTAYYPRYHLLSSGKAVHVGKATDGAMLDPVTNTWEPIAGSNYGSRAEGTSVLLPPGYDKIMIVGGGASTNTAEIIDFNEPSPEWRYTAPMAFGRSHLNAVILPDGTVLVGGGKGSDTGETVDPNAGVYPAEIFDPLTETWRTVAAMHTYRQYHSSALLLPDGRCMWAGTDDNHTYEIYSPPYLFKGPRPSITSVPNFVEYGAPFDLVTPDASSIRSAVLMRPGATTHSFNMEQRYVPLHFGVSGGALHLEAPTNPNAAPPGYYMLFILNANGVPSIAKWVKLGGDPPPSNGNRAPSVNAGPDRSIRLPAIADLAGVVTDDGLVDPLVITWSKAAGPGTVTFGNANAATTTATFSEAGTYILRFSAFDGELTGNDVVTITVRMPCGSDEFLETRIASGSDDAEENASGAVSLPGGNDLELVFDGSLQTVGLRFPGIDVPQGSVITNAYVQFMAHEVQSEPTSLRFYAHDADNAPAFTTLTRDLSSRPKTDAFTSWAPAPWNTIGEAGAAQRTPDLATVIQEIVDRPGWTPGAALAFLITGTGHRTAYSFEELAAGAPMLRIEYVCGSTNRRPVVDAGVDQALTYNPVTTPRPTTSLAGRVSDDGLPNPPARVTSVWRQISGPAGVSFADSLAPATTASFPAPGTYELSLTGYDGRFRTTDVVTIDLELVCGGTGLIETRIAVAGDDAEESSSGSVSLSGGSDLELVLDSSLQTVGLRFTGIDIKPGAVITNAWIQFMSHAVNSEATSLKIQGEDSDTAAVFTTATRNISTRPRTDAFVTWTPDPWTATNLAGAAQRTPDLVAVIQEIVDRPGFKGRSMGIVITGSGKRVAKAFESLASGAALLHIEYGCAGTNRRPTADAGLDQTIVFDPALPALPRATLTGRTGDEGLPNPPARLVSTWTQVGGPAGVTFADRLAPATTATFPGPGTYELRLTADDGALTAVDQVTIIVRSCVGAIDKRIATGNDDAEESATGSVSLSGGSDLELVLDSSLQTVALRFTGIEIRQGAVITNAWIQFMSHAINSEATSLKIQGEDADTAAVFTTATRNLSARPRTDAFVTWAPEPWTAANLAGAAQRTPDLTPVIQEIVDRPGWQGRSLTLVITGSGKRIAKAYEALATGAALLHIDYGCGNRRPTVDAGSDQTVLFDPPAAGGGASAGTAPTVQLVGRVTDDGLPNPPGTANAEWTQVSGPGAVTFANRFAPTTTATFPVNVEGTYVLSLMGSDGLLSNHDAVTITVSERRPIPNVVDRAIVAGADDAEESSSGSVSLSGGSDLEMMLDSSVQRAVALRFTGITIPPGSNVSAAWVQFKSKEARSEATTLTVRGQAHDNAPALTTTASGLSTRPMTTAAATWANVPAWTVNQLGAAQRTPDLKDVIQEIVSRPGWASGNALALIVTGGGRRTAYSYESGAANAPVLHIEYFTGPVPNRAPIVNAGPDTTVMLGGAASLRGVATDDGLPLPPSLGIMWSRISGPGSVTFDNPMAAMTRATFGAAGSYRLELMAMDGAYTTRDSVDITVLDPSRIPTVLDVRIAAGGDDVEESATSSLSPSSSDLEMMLDGSSPQRAVGLRFASLAIPRGVSITAAWIQFRAKEAHTEATALNIGAHAIDNAPVFSGTGNASSRPLTTARTQWTGIPAWVVNEAGAAQRTADLKGVIQEIVNRPGWTSGNAMAFVVTGTGRRVAHAFENGAANAPVLHVEYLNTPPPPPVNQPPVVNAGPDTSIVFGGAAMLHGRATDDGMPGALTTMWTAVGGPGSVTFDNAMAQVTRATFGVAGTYRLELKAMDGALETRDSLTVVVTPPGVNAAPVVNAGPDTTVTLPGQALLHGAATDDGLPTGSTLSVMWSKVAGTGTVTFENPAARLTRATFGAAGTYRLELMASDGALTARDSLTVTVREPSATPTIVEARIVAGGDDIEETATGAVSSGSSDLEMMIDGSTAQRAVGVRFSGLGIPQGVSVTAAWIQFKAKEAHSEATSLVVRAHAVDTAPPFTSSSNATSRPMTSAQAVWNGIPAWVVGQATAAQRTPELKDVVQEIVSRPGWATGNAMAFVITGTGRRVANAFESGATSAALLHIEYVPAPPPPPPTNVNQAPSANAGPDTTIVLGSPAYLRGRASDDGQPSPLMTHWTLAGGPGTVAFDDAMALETRAIFSATGSYRLELMAMDGALDATDTVVVTVVAPPPVNRAPTVNAGPDTTILLGGAAFLRGRATDDGLPGPMMTHWTLVGGPGTVTFDDHMMLETRATFGALGSYRLELMAMDGALATSDTVVVTVVAPAPTNRAPVAVLSVTPAQGAAPLLVTADASGSSDPDGDALGFSLSYGDGSPSGSVAVSTHEYAAGTWTLTLIVTDGRGGADTTTAVVSAVANLVTNPSFESSLTGWNANGTRATVARVAGGHHGTFCIEARGDSLPANTFGVNDAPNWVSPVAGAGARYRFSAWVRSDLHAGKVQIRVREYLNGVLQGSQLASPLTTLTPAWQQLTLEVTTSTSGSTLDFQVMNKPVVGREVFQVDDVAIVLLPSAPVALGGHEAELEIQGPPVSAAAIPTVTRFGAVFPNPTTHAAAMRFDLARDADVELEIYDLRGALVKRVAAGRFHAGTHTEAWDGRDRAGRPVAGGLYLVRFKAGAHHESRKLVIAR